MPVRSVAFRRHTFHIALLTSVSALTLLALAAPAEAGNILASGGGASAAVASASATAIASAQQAAQVAAQAQNSLARATQALQAMQAAQSAARALALAAPSAVPNGLATGGLVPDSGLASPGVANPVISWAGAGTPVQTSANGQTTVTIHQTQAQALLNWKSFNVGTGTTVDFDQQGNTKWVALNQIAATGVPSQILGSIKADGQVYLINPNGIIFGGASQVNVNALIASSAVISPSQFLTNGIYSTQTGSAYNPSFSYAGGAITVEAGAQIATSAPSQVTAGGGFVLLMGTSVENAGSITTPMGQTLLAAGDDFVVRPGFGTNANQYSTTRGNEIAVGLNTLGSSTKGGSGSVANAGLIYAPTGDITLVGETVTQSGILLSTTSVNARGTIHLLSSASDPFGSVTLGGGSLAAILPDSSGATALDSQRAALIAASGVNPLATGTFDDLSTLADLQDQSRVEIVTGGTAEFQANSLTLAQGGQVAVSAAKRIQADSGAIIDVSGLVNVALPMSANDISVNIQGNELRDAPSNRLTTKLNSNTVYVDAQQLTLVPAGTGGYSSDRYYTAGGLLEVSGWLANTPHTIGEWMATGGTITLATGGAGAVVAQPGSTFNIDGGSLQYQGGYLKQSYVQASNGQVYNINVAPANLTYAGVYNGFTVVHYVDGQPDAQLTQIYANPLHTPSEIYQPGYTVGRDAGSLILSTPTALFEGDISANVITGQQQVTARPAGVTDSYKLTQTTAPLAGSLTLAEYNSDGLAGPYTTDVKFDTVAPVTSTLDLTASLPASRVNTAWFDAATLDGFGLGGLTIATQGAIAVNAPLQLAPGAQVRLTAPTVDVAADITARSGSITVTNILPNVGALTTATGGAQLTLEAGATVDARGLWVNALTDPNSFAGLAFLNGGNVTFDSTQNLTLTKGSLIDVSSGGAILANGKTAGGKGGNVTLLAGHTDGGGTPGDGTLVLDGAIQAYGVTGGGTLTLSSPGNLIAPGALVVGANASFAGGTLTAGTPAPVALKLTQAMTIPAGQPLPTALTLTYTAIVLDAPTPVDIPLADKPPSTPTGADWTVPSGLYVWDTRNNLYGTGQVVPAGTTIQRWAGTEEIPAGTTVPSDVFPDGLPVKPYKITYAAGSVQATPMTYPVGYVIPQGAVLPQTASVAPAPGLGPTFFSAGFSNYDINAGLGLVVASGASIAPTMPVYQFTASSFAARSGSDPAAAMSLWLPPLYTENPLNATLTQRGGASLTLHTLIKDSGGALVSGGSIVVADGASIAVDPGQSVKLDAYGQITVDGSITAHGGSISLINETDGSTDALRNFDAAGNGRGISLWVGATGKLDVSGASYTAADWMGRPYGTVTNGGSISLDGGTAFVIIRPGGELNADGASVTVNSAAGLDPTLSGSTQTLAGNGGVISLSSLSGLYMDGNLHAAAGGAGAAGGSLSISLLTPAFPDTSFLHGAPANVIVPSVMTVVQSYPASVLPADIAPGTDASSLAFGQTTVSADMVEAGGFGSLTLHSDDYMQFSGNVSLGLGQSLALTAAAFTSGPAARAPLPSSGNVLLSAPYILLSEPPANIPDHTDTGSIRNPGPNAAVTTATFEADADQIDLQGLITFSGGGGYYDSSTNSNVSLNAPGFLTTKLASRGDIRFLTTTAQQGSQIATSWDLDLLAAQIYPVTSAIATVTAGENNPNYNATLTIGRTTDSVPAAPLSAFGRLTLTAPIVEQGGIVRAPFGNIVLGGGYNPVAQRVDLLPGSLTSVSMAGLTIPYGGTVDGVTYTYNGSSVRAGILTNFNVSGVASGVVLDGESINVQHGATLDLSGGGTLAGAGFISGRGGSVNVLTTPLVNANPTTPMSKSTDKVYAILPGYASGYAPVAPENGAGDPAIGQQITIPAGVPGLPSGTYTLLPSNYALLPGAYRVELGSTMTVPLRGAGEIGNGTYVTAAYTGVANTGTRSALPVTALVTPGTAVRNYSQYNEQSYSDFLLTSTAQFGAPRPFLPSDGQALVVKFELPPTVPTTGSALTFDGTALFQPDRGGISGQAVLQGVGEVYADARTSGFTGVSVSAGDLDAIGAPRLMINGTPIVLNGLIAIQGGGGDLFIRDGVTLNAAELFLVGGNITVGQDVTLSTVGHGPAPYDSLSTGLSYSAWNDTVLALSNGDLNFVGSNSGSGAITIGAGSGLYSEGTLAFAANGPSQIDPTAHFGAANIALAAGTINVGDSTTVAAAGAPSGLLFSQSLFNTLVSGDATHGTPALQSISLSAASSINLFGSAGLDASGTGVNLVLNTPAIYGYGAAGDDAKISAGKITWNGVVGATPPAIAAGGPGTGTGTLDLVATEIDFGKLVSLDTSSTSRVIYGFGNVNLTARSKIVSAGNGALYVYQAPSTAPGAVFGQSGSGGNLTLSTPLLTGVQQSVMAYTAGGALSVTVPAGLAPSAPTSTLSGAEIDLTGDSVAIGSTILLPSGKLLVNATNNVTLNAGSRIDLSGRPSMVQSATVYGFGGTAILNSAEGGVVQAPGSVIDVSATNANAGSITIGAGNGAVALDGMLDGSTTGSHTSGDFSVTAGTLADFTGLNTILTQGGIFDARSFDLKQGDLAIGNGVKAHSVTVSVDGGSLTVTGTIDASGAAPGTIRLAAANGLTLASGAVLDAHGNVLQVDSYGLPIEARNRGHIELTTTAGTLTLAPGAAMNLSTPDGVAYGDVVLNAPRVGATVASATGAGAPANATGNDVAISAAGPLAIQGARGIALDGVARYANAPADPNDANGQLVTQAWLDLIDQDSQAFVNGALANNALTGRLAGLTAYGGTFHLRPGVEIDSATPNGDLTVSGNIDLSYYRYGPNADRNTSSPTYGAGEPLALAIRAGGNLTLQGSLSDGFQSTPGVPAVYSPIDVTNSPLFSGGPANCGPYTCLADVTTNVTLLTAWTIPNDAFYNNWWGGLQDVNGNYYNPGATIPAGTVLSAGSGIAFEGSAPPAVAVVVSPAVPPAPATSATAAMLAPGSLSASVRLVAGADLAAADPRTLEAARLLNGTGNLTLNDPAYNSSLNGTYFSVVRTGTGSLDLLAGGSFSEATPYGVYTAGTQAAPILVNGSNPYDVVGTASAGGTHAYYPEQGGDLLLVAQQDVTGNIQIANSNTRFVDSDLTSNWFRRQGGGVSADPVAWWINFGSFAKTGAWVSGTQLVGFQGIGTLGGGNLTVIAGRNAGVLGNGSTGLDLAVASTGRVQADGTLVETGGGDLTVKVGGAINPVAPLNLSATAPDYYGAVTDLRGNITMIAGSIGALAPNTFGSAYSSVDPRTLDPNTFRRSLKTPGPIFTPGDGTVSVTTRGNLVFGGAGDAGMESLVDLNGMPYTLPNASGTPTLVSSGGLSSFTLWTPATAINLYAAGGDVAPLVGAGWQNGTQNGNGFYPGTLIVAAANGDIRFAEPASNSATFPVLELMPSPSGQLALLAAGSIYGSSQVVAMSGAAMNTLATPFQPVFQGSDGKSNASATSPYLGSSTNNPIAFGPDTPLTDLHAGDNQPALVYAGVDIVDLGLGQVLNVSPGFGNGFVPSPTTWYLAAKPFEVIAGRDIVGLGTTADAFFNPGANDISLIRAGRDIIYQSATIAGRGLLDVEAGRNLYQGYYGSLTSAGDVVNPADTAGGAGITVMAGVGANGPNYADFAKLYFDPANQLSGNARLTGSGKVVHAYGQELLQWLQQRFGYTGSAADALAYFLALPSEQQGVFVRQVYYEELTAGGREYNDPSSSRYKTYLRGLDAIATLFPSLNANGQPVTYSGGITMFSTITGTSFVNGHNVPVTADAGIHTLFGGNIQILDPGGKTLIGEEGVTPGAGAGLITQGSGDIDVYSLDSVLLGQSRIMTTFGGNILVWSATGDINAGRGSKTTTIFTPPKRAYDNYGDVTLSPTVPSAGAGIATLNPIPQVPPGNIDLIAPNGMVDAGEGGIRASGNLNIAALQVVNAANIQVQGTATGIPVAAAPNIGALTTASNASGAAGAAAADAARRSSSRPAQDLPSIITVEVIGYGGGETPAQDQRNTSPRDKPQQKSSDARPAYNDRSAVQVAGYGTLDEAKAQLLTPEERERLAQP
ncbi:hypothetical protein GCM10011611_10090 [Aliidongia dinghuensis]|uniref:Filamentous haemagglutinin FhaB/tRNA nuclease CdiA-like TPS domain-containing protein n=1 Tax=Aliidongia dinghuensis TaxID=1867774 RepID=A0A8J2YR68_9PROT|nr:filamentous haemagglutinin family protein [Aliidongia dinghuensis]GGF06588.1 hypothetical protein GCM10011611_10090 [Aliidongia dinghuensis]